jgi:Ser/Thr protein kinase RdoA (MazF antagonist)
MEKCVLKLFDERILEEAARRFGLEAKNLRLISNVENFIYEHQAETNPCILRVTHSSHRSLEAILGELDWIESLHINGISVPRPVPSQNGALVEGIECGQTIFLATVFQKLPGKTILDAKACTTEMYRLWGQVLGKLHILAKNYAPSQPAYRRDDWCDNDIVQKAEQYLAGQAGILEKFTDLKEQLHSLSRNRDSYGLIHTDLTDVNFFVHDHQIAVFDFDDCEYHWFIYDMAVILFECPPWLPHEDMNEVEFRRYFWRHFMEGYNKENTLDGFWFEWLPFFIKWHEMFLYIVFHKKWDLEHLDERRAKMLQAFKHNIENDVPCLDIRELGG